MIYLNHFTFKEIEGFVGPIAMSHTHGEKERPPHRDQWLSDRVDSLRQDLKPLLHLQPDRDPPQEPEQVSNKQIEKASEVQMAEKMADQSIGSLGGALGWDVCGPYADVAFGSAMGVGISMEALQGSIFGFFQVDPEGVEKTREKISQRLDRAWSNEALRRGVAQARAGAEVSHEEESSAGLLSFIQADDRSWLDSGCSR